MDHVGAISVYVAIVLLGVPVAVGGLLNRYLAGVVSGDGPPNLFAAGLGGGEASDAFDHAISDGARTACGSSSSS